MEQLSLEEIINAVDGEVVFKGDKTEYNAICTDTRKIQNGNIFIALKGENFNGNNFIGKASEKGAVICIGDEINDKPDDIGRHTTVIKVKDTNKALKDLAKYYRSKLHIKVIAVTGSTGKTSTKDLIAAVLSEKYSVFKTEGNFNNEIGLPLMIFKLDRSYDVAVLEMGMSHFGEIHNMADVARPDIAVITNIGISHIEYLKTRENILKAKMEITDFFNKDSILIVNGDNDLLSKMNYTDCKFFKVGTDESFDLNARKIELGEQSISFDLFEKNKSLVKKFNVDIPGRHNVLNSLLAISCGRTLNMNFSDIQKGIKNLQSTSMRLDIIREGKFTIVNDCYNASPDSMVAAVDVLKNIKCKRRIAVLGSMLELGNNSFKEHKDIAVYCAENNIDILVSIGMFNKAYSEGFSSETKNSKFQEKIYKGFENYEEAVEYLLSILEAGDVVLVKASRSMKFEKIVKELMKNNS